MSLSFVAKTDARSPGVPPRRGFTLVELLVVITIIGMLLAMLLPAVMSARGSGRRAVCMNNLHNVGLAMLQCTESQRRFPTSGYYRRDTHEGCFNWVVQLLPFLERRDLAEAWNYDKAWSHPENMKIGSTSLAVLACPDDVTCVPGQGNLSYAVNGGMGWTTHLYKDGQAYEDCPVGFLAPDVSHTVDQAKYGHELDLDGDGRPGGAADKKLYFQMGLFFAENWPRGKGTVRYHTPDSVLDGMSNTLLLAECIRVGYDPVGEENWSMPHARYQSFFLSPYICKDWSCSEGNVDYANANNHSAMPYRLEAINGERDQAEGEAPWASSYHIGGVHVAFCDGRVQFMSDDIDGAVYAALISPQGTQIKGPLAQGIPLPAGERWLH
jgi:prepilin-type N-terminal cleavage/methylation domain-containing protein/prepilin-type processing-associated H-X9-DG protein